MLTACGRSQRDVVNEFVSATKEKDLATLAKVSIVPLSFEIASWRITRTTMPREEPFDFQAVQQRLSQARAARDAALAVDDETERLRIQSRVDRLRVQLEKQREAARKSLRTWSSIDGLVGAVEVSEIELSLRSPEGLVQAYALTLKRYSLAHPETGSRPAADWVVTAIQPGT